MSREMTVTRAALLAAARGHHRQGISARVALILAYAELVGHRLDPERRDDAAVILRAERLLLDEVPVAEALRTACAEFVTFAEGRKA